MLRNGVIPMPSASSTAGRVAWLESVKFPNGPATLALAPSGAVERMRLKAISRKRVAKVSRRSSGALVMKNARVFPLSSISGGSIHVISANWPALKSNPGGRSNSNASVCSAIGYRSKSRTVRVGELTQVSASLIVGSSPAPRIRPVNHLHSPCGFAQGLVMAEGITENVGCFVPLKRFSQDIEPAGIQHFGPEEPTIT